MSYITTKIQALKSYPTYQFFAEADSGACSADEIFRICILETLRWLRSRLRDFTDLPEAFLAPEPEQYASFSADALTSFSYNNGFQIDIVYIDTLGVWSFRMAEPDMGANAGTPRARAAVNGRSFTTEIAFRKQENSVQIGVRTVCSEPADTSEQCEVFRPRLIKALIENPLLRLQHGGWTLNGKPLKIRSKANLERFLSVLTDTGRSLPIVLIADSKTETHPQPAALPPVLSAVPSGKYSLSGFSQPDPEADPAVSLESGKKTGFIVQNAKQQKPKSRKPAAAAQTAAVRTKLPVIDYNGLASDLTGFAIVVFADESCFRQIGNKTRISVGSGDIIIIPRQLAAETFPYENFRDDPEGFTDRLRSNVIAMQKRAAYSFGDVLFYSDAKLKDYHVKRHQTSSLEERCAIFQQEKDELKAQIQALSQQQTDMQQTAEALRIAQKRIEALTGALEEKEAAYQALAEQAAQKDEAYRRGAEYVQFYRQMLETVTLFPKDKNDVSDWAKAYYADDIIIAPRAQSELRKYSSRLDLNVLCDGIVYLAAYARYRRQELSGDMLTLFAERNHWDIQFCGKEAMRMHRTDYTVTVGSSQYTLDQHIKHGIHAEELIRIYFCWDEESRKILIGSMPGHLATVRNST